MKKINILAVGIAASIFLTTPASPVSAFDGSLFGGRSAFDSQQYTGRRGYQGFQGFQAPSYNSRPSYTDQILRDRQIRRQQERNAARRDYRDLVDDAMRDSRARHNIEPGHIPYPCGMSRRNSAAQKNCQENWKAHNPNDYLWYGR